MSFLRKNIVNHPQHINYILQEYKSTCTLKAVLSIDIAILIKKKKNSTKTDPMAKTPQIGNKSTENLFEDFHPMSEWLDEPENNILLVHLPGMLLASLFICIADSLQIIIFFSFTFSNSMLTVY